MGNDLRFTPWKGVQKKILSMSNLIRWFLIKNYLVQSVWSKPKFGQLFTINILKCINTWIWIMWIKQVIYMLSLCIGVFRSKVMRRMCFLRWTQGTGFLLSIQHCDSLRKNLGLPCWVNQTKGKWIEAPPIRWPGVLFASWTGAEMSIEQEH